MIGFYWVMTMIYSQLCIRQYVNALYKNSGMMIAVQPLQFHYLFHFTCVSLAVINDLLIFHFLKKFVLSFVYMYRVALPPDFQQYNHMEIKVS